MKATDTAASAGFIKIDKPRVYEIRVEGHLTDRWSDWFDELAILNDPNGETTLSGPLVDQAALFGVFTKLHALNLTLISVNRVPPEKSCSPAPISTYPR